jgi:hypothetical protein
MAVAMDAAATATLFAATPAMAIAADTQAECGVMQAAGIAVVL